MEETTNENVGILPDVLASVRSIIVGGVRNYYERARWFYVVTGYCGADFPIVLLLEVDANERYVLR